MVTLRMSFNFSFIISFLIVKFVVFTIRLSYYCVYYFDQSSYLASKMSARGKNFTEREKCKLLELIKKYKDIIENKCTNAVLSTKKTEAWEAITIEFNSTAEVPRTVKQLHTAYLNLKRSTRKNLANENVKKYIEMKQNVTVIDCEAGPSQTVIMIDESREVEEVNSLSKQFQKDEIADKSNTIEANEIKSILKQFKKDEIADKKGVRATGGGMYKPVLSNVGAQMLSLMGDQVKPLSNDCDSASNYYSTDDVVITDNLLKQELHPRDNTPPIQKQSKINERYIKKKTSENKSNNLLKTKYYKKKLECALLEKRTKLVEYRIALKKQQLLDLEIKIKEKEYDNMTNK